MNVYTKKELTLLETPFDDIRRKMDLLLLLGQLLMENGANTNQILRDMLRAAAYMGINENLVHVHISYTTIMLNISDDSHAYTVFRKTLHHGVNMTTLSVLSKLTWKALEQSFTLDEFEKRLRTIAETPPRYPHGLLNIAAGFACGAFALLFGGTILSAWVTTLCAIIGFFVRTLCNRWEVNIYISIMAAAFAATTSAYLLHTLFASDAMIYAMISCTLFMIPGVPLINAVDDMINNHIMAGMTRAMNTFLIVGSMTVGITMALYFDRLSNFTSLSILPGQLYPLQLAASVVGAIGFSIIFNIPYRLLPLVGIGGLIAVAIRNTLLVYLGFSLPGATFLATAIISICALKSSRYFRTAAPVLSIPSVIPLIPGVLLYRFLFGIVTINTLDTESLLHALRSGVTGITTIICIAIGVSIPHILASRYLDRAKHQRLLQLLQDRGAGHP